MQSSTGCKSKSKVPSWLLSGGTLCLACGWLPAPCVFTRPFLCAQAKGQVSGVSHSSCKHTCPVGLGSRLGDLTILVMSLNTVSSNAVTLGLKASRHNLFCGGRGDAIQSLACLYKENGMWRGGLGLLTHRCTRVSLGVQRRTNPRAMFHTKQSSSLYFYKHLQGGDYEQDTVV